MDQRRMKTFEDVEKEKSTITEIPVEPFRAICMYCRKDITTYVKYENSVLTWPAAILALYLYGLYGILLLFLIVPLMKNALHTCPNCLQLLHVRQFYPIKYENNFFMLQFGTCIIILRKLWVFIILGLIASFGLYLNINYYFFQTHLTKDYINREDEVLNKFYDPNSKDLTWEGMLNDCGAQVMIENAARGNEIFNKKYFKNTVTWKGYYLNSFFEVPTPWGYSLDHVLNINVRMIPSESIEHSDLFLSLDLRTFERYKHLISTSLKIGDPIKFKATIESLGNEWRTHHLHLIELEKTDDFIDESKKVTLFHGATFEIKGHLKHHGEVIPLNNDTINKVKEKEGGGITYLEDNTKKEETPSSDPAPIEQELHSQTKIEDNASTETEPIKGN